MTRPADDPELSWCADDEAREHWREDSLHWRGHVMTGVYAHWCDDWDGLPIDEHSYEWPCVCAADLMQYRPSPPDQGER